MDLPGRRLGDITFNVRRGFAGVALVLFLATAANWAWDWGLLGSHGKGALAFATAALFLTMRYLGPTVEDLRAYRLTSRRDQGQSD